MGKGWASQEWSEVQGQVVRKEIKKISGIKGNTKKNIKLYYRYTVQGKEYDSENLGCVFINQMKLFGKFKKGDGITVYYNKEKPAESVVYRGVEKSMYYFMGGWAVAFLLGVIALFAFIRMGTKSAVANDQARGEQVS